MAATTTEQPSNCTWGSVCKGIARIAMVVVVGVAIWYGIAGVLKLTGNDIVANTMIVNASTVATSIAGIPTAIASYLGGFVGLGGDAAASGSLTGVGMGGTLPDPASVNIPQNFGPDYADVGKSFTSAQGDYYAWKKQIIDKGLWDTVGTLESVKKLETFFNPTGLDSNFSYDPKSFVGSVDAKLPTSIPALKTEILDMKTALATAEGNAKAAFNAIPDIARDGNLKVAEIADIAKSQTQFTQSLANHATQIRELDGLYQAKIAGGAATSTAALATAVGVGAAGTAGVAYLAGGREPKGKWTERIDNEKVRNAAYAEAFGEPSRG